MHDSCERGIERLQALLTTAKVTLFHYAQLHQEPRGPTRHHPESHRVKMPRAPVQANSRPQHGSPRGRVATGMHAPEPRWPASKRPSRAQKGACLLVVSAVLTSGHSLST